jgi:hypothetical protein
MAMKQRYEKDNYSRNIARQHLAYVIIGAIVLIILYLLTK